MTLDRALEYAHVGEGDYCSEVADLVAEEPQVRPDFRAKEQRTKGSPESLRARHGPERDEEGRRGLQQAKPNLQRGHSCAAAVCRTLGDWEGFPRRREIDRQPGDASR